MSWILWSECSVSVESVHVKSLKSDTFQCGLLTLELECRLGMNWSRCL